MSSWREDFADQNLRMANKMLEQQGTINDLKAELVKSKRVVEAARAWVSYGPAPADWRGRLAQVEELIAAVDALDAGPLPVQNPQGGTDEVSHT